MVIDAIELLMENFKSERQLKPLVGMEWEFVLDGKCDWRAAISFLKLCESKIVDFRDGLKRPVKTYQSFVFENNNDVVADGVRPILEITTDPMSALQAPRLIEQAKIMLAELAREHGFNGVLSPEFLPSSKKKEQTLGLHTSISFSSTENGTPFYDYTQVENPDFLNAALTAGCLMPLFVADKNSYTRFKTKESNPPSQIGVRLRGKDTERGVDIPADLQATSYALRIGGDIEAHRIENRIPGASTDPYEASLGTLLSFYAVMNPSGVFDVLSTVTSNNPLANPKNGLSLFQEGNILQQILDPLQSNLGTKLQEALIARWNGIFIQKSK